MPRAIPGSQHLPSQPATVFESSADKWLRLSPWARDYLEDRPADQQQAYSGMSPGHLGWTPLRGPTAIDHTLAAIGVTGAHLQCTKLSPITSIRGTMQSRPRRLGDRAVVATSSALRQCAWRP